MKDQMKIDLITFLDNLKNHIDALGIDLSDAALDHVAYQTSSTKEYDQLKVEFEKIGEIVKEPVVSGRRVGVFKFYDPPIYNGRHVNVIELVEPKGGVGSFSGLQHAEYLLPVSLEEFIDKNPTVNWNTEALNRDQYPMLTLQLTENMQVKFPRKSILD